MNRSSMCHVVMLLVLLAAKLLLATGGGSYVWTYEIIAGYEWRYTLYDDKATLVSAPQAIGGRLDVPERFGIYPVVRIAPSALAGRDDLRELHLPEGIVEIGYNAFQNCTNLTELVIPDTVQTIGGGVFDGCISLKKLTIPFVGTNRGMADISSRDRALRSQFGYMFYTTSPGLAAEREGMRIVPSGINYWGDATYVYYIPTNLEEVVVTDDTLITMKAFYRCEDIKRIAILGNVSEVEESAFEGCSSLETATFTDGLESLGYAAFKGCIRLKPETLASLPSSVKSIGDYAFAGCSSGMVDIVMPEGLTKIGAYAFQGCCSATNVSVSSTVSDIGVSALEGCIGLSELAIPDTVQTIGGGAFGGCISLKKLTIPFVGTNRGMADTSSRDRALRSQFGYMFYTTSPGLAAEREGMRIVPSGINYWGDATYVYYIPTNLEEVVVTDDTLITVKAFYQCEDIKRIMILGNVTEVEESAFEGCSGLECLTIFGNKPEFGREVFAGVQGTCTLLVPRYSSGWGTPIPGTWNGLAIGYITDELLPEVSDEAAVAEKTASFVDASITANVKTLEQYDAFREWAYAVKLSNGAWGGSQAAKNSPSAWLSFALGADRLIGRDIVPEDVRIVSFDAGSGGAKGALSFVVAIDGVEIGGGQVAMETLKKNLNNVLGVEGAARLDNREFSSDGIEINFDAPVDGKARFTVTPPAGADSVYFMRVKMK